MLKRGKYKIKVLNTINFAKSMHYNPFAYIRSEKDILKLVNTIIVNTKGEGQQSDETSGSGLKSSITRLLSLISGMKLRKRSRISQC